MLDYEKMTTIVFEEIALVLLKKQLDAFPNENQEHIAYGLQDYYQCRAHTSPRVFGYDYENFSGKQRDFLYSISDALMTICNERFGRNNL